MQVQDIMSANPACCTPSSTIEQAAQLMAAHDCGEIPVLDERGCPMGVVTDRDIACRAVAQGRSPQTRVMDVMSVPAITVSRQTSVEECCEIMEDNQIRRVPVVDSQGVCCGMVAQADLAIRGSEEMAGELVRDVSRPAANGPAARV